jgi:dCMP deaminase
MVVRTTTAVSDRPSWDDWAIGLAFAVARRADCRRRQVGAVILAANKRLVATGYNGTRPGKPGCLAGLCPRGLRSYSEVPGHTPDYDMPGPGYCISTHAEMNAVLYVDPLLMPEATLYCTLKPCEGCMKIIGNTPMYRIVYPIQQMDVEAYYSAIAYSIPIALKTELI